MRRPVYLSHAGIWSAAGQGAAEVRRHLAEGRVPESRVTCQGQAWPYARPEGPESCEGRLDAALAVVETSLDMARFPRQAPLLLGSSSLLVGAAEEAGAEAPFQSVEGLQDVIQQRWGLSGPAWTFSCACASAVHALEAGVALLETGVADEAVVVGVELFNRTTLAGFAAMQLLSSTACRPLDRDRDGLVLGEGVAAVRLSVHPGHWRIHGPALGLDASSPTGLQPDGIPIARGMAAALNQAGYAPDAVEAVKLQAAGSPGADAAEAHALRHLFGETTIPRLLSLKASLGHALGACGLVEMVALLACAEEDWLPGTAGFQSFDPDLGLSPEQAAGPYRGGPLLLNIQGFGGCLTSWVVGRS